MGPVWEHTMGRRSSQERVIFHVDNKPSSSRHNLPNAMSILAAPATAVDDPMLNDMFVLMTKMNEPCVENLDVLLNLRVSIFYFTFLHLVSYYNKPTIWSRGNRKS